MIEKEEFDCIIWLFLNKLIEKKFDIEYKKELYIYVFKLFKYIIDDCFMEFEYVIEEKRCKYYDEIIKKYLKKIIEVVIEDFSCRVLKDYEDNIDYYIDFILKRI